MNSAIRACHHTSKQSLGCRFNAGGAADQCKVVACVDESSEKWKLRTEVTCATYERAKYMHICNGRSTSCGRPSVSESCPQAERSADRLGVCFVSESLSCCLAGYAQGDCDLVP